MSLSKVLSMPLKQTLSKMVLVVVGGAKHPFDENEDWNNPKQCATDDLISLTERYPDIVKIHCIDPTYPRDTQVSPKVFFQKDILNFDSGAITLKNEVFINDVDTHYVIMSYCGGLVYECWTSVNSVFEMFKLSNALGHLSVTLLEYGCGWKSGFDSELPMKCFENGIFTPLLPSTEGLMMAFRNTIDIQDLGMNATQIFPFLHGQIGVQGSIMHLKKDGGMIRVWTRFIESSGMLEDLATPENLVVELSIFIIERSTNWSSLSYPTRSGLESMIFGINKVDIDKFFASQYS